VSGVVLADDSVAAGSTLFRFSWNADIVFLQEVLVETVSVLENRLPEYQFIYGNGITPMADYFTVVMLKKSLVAYKRHTEVPFEGSRMGRTLMIVEVNRVITAAH